MTPERIHRPLVIALFAAISFVIVAVSYRAGALRQMDAEVAARLGGLHSDQLYAAASVDDVILRVTPAFVFAGVLALVLFVKGAPWSWLAPLGIVGSAAVDFAMKAGWSALLHPRQILSAAQMLIGEHYHGLSPFPSGHVERSTFLAVVALAFFPRWISAPLVALALFTPVARLYLEAHRLSEVLGGFDLGVLLGACAIAVVAAAPQAAAIVRRLLARVIPGDVVEDAGREILDGRRVARAGTDRQ